MADRGGQFKVPRLIALERWSVGKDLIARVLTRHLDKHVMEKYNVLLYSQYKYLYYE
jgi:hypothetical protein